jgi:peptidoglycan hydrolase-like protein with peptidoglycan-binding domain
MPTTSGRNLDRNRAATRVRTQARHSPTPPRRNHGARYVMGGILLVFVGLFAAGALILVSANASLTTASNGIAKVGLPLGGGKIESAVVTAAPTNRTIPTYVRDNEIWPRKTIPAHTLLTIQVLVKRPSWISWLAGDTQRLRLVMMTPSAKLTAHYLTIPAGAPLKLQFVSPIKTITYGHPGHMVRRELASPLSTITIDKPASAGTIDVAAVPYSWETSNPTLVSWFPNGPAAVAVASPAPGSKIEPGTPITLTFNKPVSKVLGSDRPPVLPDTTGTWHAVSDHAIRFQPEGYGYGLGTTVSVGLPSGVRLVGASGSSGTWQVPTGSTLRLQQLLANLGYLPYTFSQEGSPTPLTPAAQMAAAINQPNGTFALRYANTPSALTNMWEPGASGTMTKGAIMAFESNNNLNPDGVAGPAVWKALINAEIRGQRSTFGYTFVSVSIGSPETQSTWHNGKTVSSGLVNTGAPASPTATGVYPVFEHTPSTTMSGYNPDGSYYSDPGIPWVSYFNGGDALHGYIRDSYGFPQSNGCVEMPYSEAAQVYQYTPIGTLVDVQS